MKPRSAKAKGRKLQNTVRDLIQEHFPQLHPDDVVSTQMGGSGVDIQLSPAARKVFPYSIECKNQEAVNVWKSYEQAKENSGNYEPVLFIKRNNTKALAVVDADYFINLHKNVLKKT